LFLPAGGEPDSLDPFCAKNLFQDRARVQRQSFGLADFFF
jgi:hypothetical protein